MPSFVFPKEAHLKSRKTIQLLFKEGHSFSKYPLRLVWIACPQGSHAAPLQFAFTVPRKAFPRAVDRNRLRRQVREAVRLQRHFLAEKKPVEGPDYGLMLIYTAREPLPFEVIAASVRKIFGRFAGEMERAAIS